MDVVVALEIPQADRDIGLADDDGARRLQPRDDEGIFRRLEVFEMRKAPGRRQAGDVEGFFQGHGNAEQRLPRAASLARSKSRTMTALIRGSSASMRAIV